RFNYLLDYERRSVRIEMEKELLNSVSGERIQFEISEGKMLVPSELHSFGRAPVLLLLDSGADAVILFRKVVPMRLEPLGGSLLDAYSRGHVRHVDMGRIDALTVGGQEFRNLALAISPALAVDVPRLDGLLPTALFRVLYINNRERFVMLNPKFKKTGL